MIQEEKLDQLKQDPQTFNQLKVMFKIIDEAFRNNMEQYIKLVQLDVMKEFKKKCEEDGVGPERMKFTHEVLDEALAQVNSDLHSRIMKRFKSVKDLF